MFGIVVSATISLHAASPTWPSDFWTQVTNHINAVAPSGVQVSTANRSMRSADRVVASSPAYGTTELPFSTVCPATADSGWVNVITSPVGAMIIIR